MEMREDRVDSEVDRRLRIRATAPMWLPTTTLLTLIALAAPEHAYASENLVLIPEPQMLIAMVILFVALVFPVNALIFKPIFRALDERANRISGARQRADHIAADADSVLARYDDSIRAARAGAEASRKQAITEARTEQAAMAVQARNDAEVLIEKARADLTEALEHARTELRAGTQELGRAAAQRILGREL
jgi:F-type H+-transporting ATPase subunit b